MFGGIGEIIAWRCYADDLEKTRMAFPGFGTGGPEYGDSPFEVIFPDYRNKLNGNQLLIQTEENGDDDGAKTQTVVIAIIHEYVMDRYVKLLDGETLTNPPFEPGSSSGRRLTDTHQI